MKKSVVRDQKGAVMVVEATFVFPIMFFIVFFMIMAGNIYFQQARVERIVSEAAIEATSRCENPMLAMMKDGSMSSNPLNDGIKPYRYLFSGYVKNECKSVRDAAYEKIDNFGALGFAGMEANIDSFTMTPHIYLVVSYVDVYCKYNVAFPIKMIFSDRKIDFDFYIKYRQPISDPAELIRNVSAVEDFAESNEQVQSFLNKLEPVVGKVKKFVNYLN